MVVIGILPGFIWLIFFLKEDFHPEPKRLIFYTFFVGAIISLPVFLSQLLFQNVFSFLKESGLIYVIGLAFIEEIFKFFAAYLAIHDNPAFDEPIDAMIYMIAAALGFATIENIFIAINTVNIFETTNLVILRFVGATLLHALASGLVGYQWALGIAKKMAVKFLFKGVIYATLIHSFFNYFILKFKDDNLIYSSILLLVAAFFVFGDFEKLRKQKNVV